MSNKKTKQQKKIGTYGAQVKGDLAKVLGKKDGTRVVYSDMLKGIWKVIKPLRDPSTNTYNLAKSKFAKELKNIYGKSKIKMTEVGKALGNKKYITK